jgi:hypothetical protein
MKFTLVLRALLLVALTFFALPPNGAARQAPDAASPTLDAARQRWERLTPAEKERLRERYESYRNLSEEDRRNLANRARRLRDDAQRVQSSLPPETREKMQQLEPEKRRELMKDMVAGEAREKGARIREKMPEAWIERLEKARPEDRARFLAEFQHKARERVALAAIDKIGKRLELPKAEIERLQKLPGAERAAAVLELKKKLSTRDAAEFGLPNGITAEQWEEWQKLPPEQFFEAMQRLRHERQVRANEANAAATEEGSSAPEALSPERLHAARSVLEALRLRPEDIVELADVPQPQREARILEKRRERVLEALVRAGLATPEQLTALRRLPEGSFVRGVRDLLPPLGAGRAAPRVKPGSDGVDAPAREPEHEKRN